MTGFHNLNKSITFITVAVILCFVSGCTVKYPVVGYFYHYNEVFKGTITHNIWIGHADIEVQEQVSGVKGTGYSYVTYIPPFGTAKGQRGKAIIECNDGRVVEADWVADSLTSGRGTGHDQDGHRFVFCFGLSDDEANEYVQEQMQLASSRPELPGYRPKETRQEKGYSTGTGFFVTDEGHVITNAHVVESAGAITVIVHNGAKYTAKLVRIDLDNDVALLKIDAAGQPLRLATGHQPEKGQEVCALGYPLISIQGQETKATFGRVNSLTGIQGDPRFMQIDTPIQPGNSGGPLLNDQGEVIGVVTATLDQFVTLVRSGSLPQNVNYAVKAEHVKSLLINVQQYQHAVGKPSSSTSMSMPEVVRAAEPSVVLVVSR